MLIFTSPFTFFKPPSKPYRIGLTLSGGGAKCMAQVGLLQYLKEQHIEPDIVSGTSAGAMVGALYCGGYAPADILEIFISTRLFNLRNFAFNKMGLIDSRKISIALKPYFLEDSFEALSKPLHVAVTDLNHAVGVEFSTGRLCKALAASSAYPAMFTPVKWDDALYADGGIINNYPLNLIHHLCEHHIGMSLAPLTTYATEHFENTFDVMDRVFQIYGARSQHETDHLAHMALIPEGIEAYSAFMVKAEHMHKLYELGYQCAKQYFENEGAEWLKTQHHSAIPKKRLAFKWLIGSDTP